METQKKLSTDNQQKLLSKIAQAGDLNEISFARKVIDFDKISEIEHLGDNLGVLFLRITNLLGIKNAIEGVNKLDIREMLLKRFKTISLEEIDYAFKLERYGSLGNRTEHFQLFNAQYVSDVLDKYKKWLQKTRHDNNLPLSKKKLIKEIPEEEKQLLILQGVVSCFDEFIQTNKVINGYTWVYDHLDELNLLDYTTDQKNAKMLVAANKLKKQANNIKDRLNRKNILANLENKKSKSIINEAKRMLLKDFFAQIEVKNKHIKDFI